MGQNSQHTNTVIKTYGVLESMGYQKYGLRVDCVHLVT